MTKRLYALAFACVAAAAFGCVDASKSSTPLSPDIAGPIAGVSISAPKEASPTVNTQISTNSQPITLTLWNATTTGVRPLSYLFEVATDSGFVNKVFTRDAVAQDSSGQTSVRLPSALAPDRYYYWHARAEDGANTGPFTLPVGFNVYTPVVLGAPTLISPIEGATASTQPTFVVGNASRSGPAGAVSYYVEVADSSSFSHIVGAYTMGEGSSRSSVTATSTLVAGTYFWRARAFTAKTTGPFSNVESFTASASGGGGGGGGDLKSIILAATQGLAPTQANMFIVMDRLRAQGYQASVLYYNGAYSDHKTWINGAEWSIISSDRGVTNFRWDPYLQVAYDGSGWNSCGIPNSLGWRCP